MHQPLAIATFSPRLPLTRSRQSNRSLSLLATSSGLISPRQCSPLERFDPQGQRWISQVTSYLSKPGIELTFSSNRLVPPCPPPSSCRRRAVHHVGDDEKHSLARVQPSANYRRWTLFGAVGLISRYSCAVRFVFSPRDVNERHHHTEKDKQGSALHLLTPRHDTRTGTMCACAAHYGDGHRK